MLSDTENRPPVGRSLDHCSSVLHVAWLKARYGGAHKYLDRLVRHLLEKRYRVSLAVNEQTEDRPFLKSLSKLGVEVYFLPLDSSPELSAKRLDQIVEAFRPDIVHFNSGAKHPRAAAAKMTTLKKRRFRTVFTMHLPLIRVEPKTNILHRIPFTGTNRSLTEKASFAKQFDRIISVSERFADVNIRGLSLNLSHVVSIPNGVDITQFTPSAKTAQETNPDEIIIGACGGLVPQKRFDLLIDAVAKIDNPPLSIRIAGEGPERDRLQKKIDDLKLTDKIQLIGHQTDVSTFLRQLDIFVMPSDYEAAPYSQLEAMATGLPSIVTNVGDLPLMVRDGLDGIVIPVGDTEALSTAIRLQVSDESMRRNMGVSARRRAVEHFEQNACESKTLELFESLLNHECDSE